MGSPRYLLIDIGTHAARALITDSQGDICASSIKSYPLKRINTHQVEQAADELANSLTQVITKVINEAVADEQTPVAVAIACQRSSVVAWNRVTGEPYSPILSWQDSRAYPKVQELTAEAATIHQLSGLPLTPYYGASKIAWLQQWCSEHLNDDELATLVITPLSSFLTYHLVAQPKVDRNTKDMGSDTLNPKCKVQVKVAVEVDEANAARTQLYDIHQRCWSETLCQLFGVNRDYLPAVRTTQSNWGEYYFQSDDSDSNGSDDEPQGERIPIKLITGDQNAAFYALNISPEQALINLGSGAFILQPYQQSNTHRKLLTTLLSSKEEHCEFAQEATINGADTALRYLIDKLNLPDDYPWQREINNWLLEETSPPLFINRVGGLASPFWQIRSDSYFFSQDEEDDRVRYELPEIDQLSSHMVAVAESIVFLVKANLDELTNTPQEIMLTGGLSRIDALCQKIADLSQVPVSRVLEPEQTAMGLLLLLTESSPTDRQSSQLFSPSQNSSLAQRYQQFMVELMSENQLDQEKQHKHQYHNSELTRRLVAHRGQMVNYPENTAISFEHAFELGSHSVECDIQLLGDTTPVVIHDDNLLRTSGVDKSLMDLTNSDLQHYSVHRPELLGEKFNPQPVMTLSQFISLAHRYSDRHIFFECKRQSIERYGSKLVAEKVFPLLKEFRGSCHVISFNREILTVARQQGFNTGYILPEVNQQEREFCNQFQPELLLCNVTKVSGPEDILWRNHPWQWLVYDLLNCHQAKEWFEAGADFVETGDMETLLRQSVTSAKQTT